MVRSARPTVLASIALLATGAAGSAQLTTRVSLSTSGTQGNAGSWGTSISADGRYVAFGSEASNLVVGDTNGKVDVFVHDGQTGTTALVSVDSGGGQGNADSYYPSISADGRFVAFYSAASNLVAGDTNGWPDIFLRDILSGTTERVSVDSGGAEGNGASFASSMSADGRFVAFGSEASNLVAGDTNLSRDVFVHDRLTGATRRVSVDSNGIEGASESSGPAISADGRFVAFTSFAPNLVTNDTNGASDIFVRDRLTGTTERVSVNSVGGQANGASSFCSISGNGNCVAFECSASNLVVGDTNGRVDVFVRDRLTGMTERASVSTSGAEGDSDSFYPSISADGRCVAFESDASNLVPATTTPWIDIFVRDRQTRTTERASSSTAGAEENFDSYGASISADGRCVAFASGASNLVAADTNNKADAFVRDRGPQDCNGNGVADDQDIQSGTSADCNANGVPDECDMPTMDCDGNAQIDSCEIASNPALDFDHNGTLDRCQDAGTPYCFGDGSGHACPCDPGQIGATGHGCANSSGEGAILSATGVASVTGDDLQLHVANMPNPSSVLFFQGTVQQGSGQGSFNGDGLLCVNGPGGNLIRLGIHAGQPGTSSYGAGIGNDPLISVRGLIPAIGGTRYYQAWFRDSTAFCTSANFNFSNGLAIVWTP